MKKVLIDVIFASEKRKNVLLLLKDGPKETKNVLELLETTRQSLLPQIKVLEEHHLLSHKNDVCELTKIGKLLVEDMMPLLDTVDVLDTDIEYWGTRKLDFIPTHLLERIDELDECSLIDPDITNVYNAHQAYHETCAISKSIFAVTTFLYPDFHEMYSRLIHDNIKSTIIMSPDLYNKLETDRYSGFKDLMDSNLMHFYLYSGKIDFMSFGYNDYQFVMSPLTNTGDFDNKHLLFSSPQAREWGKELFEHYLKDSTPITEI
ncbi:helix-turn-helix transcriptional regulator [Methanolobus halotolerans]|uniref:Transcriptional regulator n=1 Tax=Methanolobus halotolerans TaxID=2052935 RepID=A0A4E0PSW4_9EURY|nr:winged helix-turn-helix domain-containing protein [Methanolobus halotolerans]TGC06986.1 transcriptional regulator [Methanolobus halotolerans]